MAQLAIKGHKERGKEVIALLEMLGGKNESLIPYDGRDTDSSYRITDDGCIFSSRFCPNKKGVKYQTYTLEVFEVVAHHHAKIFTFDCCHCSIPF